jgi:HPt (histidine-containing phosphotransfer) domain-containing protein
MSGKGGELAPDALKRLGEWGGDELVSKMVELFLQVTPERVEAIRSGVQEEDLKRVERGAHSLRSSAGNLGAERVQELAGRIEELASLGNREGLAPLVEKLETHFRATVQELEAVLAERRSS